MPPFGEKDAPIEESVSFHLSFCPPHIYVFSCLLLTQLEFPGACSGITEVTATPGTRSAPERRKEMIKATLGNLDTGGA